MIQLIVLYFIVAFLFGFFPFEGGFLYTSSISPFQYTYDEGYEDGYEGADPKIESSPYIDGYEDGDIDAECEWLKYTKKDFARFKRTGCGDWSNN